MPATTTRPATARIDRLAARLDRATPAGRDRLIDLVRVAAMLVVAFGHWLAAAVVVTAGREVEAASILSAVPWTQALTWALQVMGLFFAVAGWSSAASLSRLPDGSAADWVTARLGRVLAPTVVYVGVWALAGPLVAAAAPGGTSATAIVAVQLWFVAVIVLVFAATPWLWRAWRRWGWTAIATPTVAAAAVDVAHRILEVPAVGWANFALVWSVPTLLGFAWHDGRLGSAAARRALTVGGLVALVAAVATPWLPLSMVGVDGAAQSNNSPPSVALIALTCLHVGLVLTAAPHLRRWLARPRVWLAVAIAGRVSMTTFLWHLTALVVGVAVLAAVGGNGFMGAVGSLRWWAWRPVWLAALASITVPLVLAARGPETSPTRASSGACVPGRGRVAAGVVLSCAGAALLALGGFVSEAWYALPPLGGLNAGAFLVLVGAVAVGALPVRTCTRGRSGLGTDVAPHPPGTLRGDAPA